MNYWVEIEIILGTIAIALLMLPFWAYMILRQLKIRNDVLRSSLKRRASKK